MDIQKWKQLVLLKYVCRENDAFLNEQWKLVYSVVYCILFECLMAIQNLENYVYGFMEISDELFYPVNCVAWLELELGFYSHSWDSNYSVNS